ncbi:MAG TPA: SCO family protein [Nitrospirales bacterium]|nr:SCO family protein [Nitrospirales bacterium]HIB53912.1 SCO family protein [Nitrospirales bacterium]
MKSTNFAVSPIPRTLGIYVACIGLAWGMSGGSSAIGHFQHDEDVATESGQSVPVVAGNPAPDLPNVTLTTQDGRSVRVHDLLDNQLSIINFIYTSCTNVCPLTTANFLQLEQLAGDRDFQMISISIDPKRDTPARLRKFMQAQGAMSPRWTFLTGSPRVIAPLLGGFGFYNVAVDDHSPGVVIWDGKKQQWTRLVSLPPPHVLFEELRKFFPG